MHDHPDGGEMLNGDQLIEYCAKLGEVNLKSVENKIYDINKRSVGRPLEETDKLTKYKNSNWQTGLTAKQWVDY
eukprot:2070776-Prymnesium_polylepis.1